MRYEIERSRSGLYHLYIDGMHRGVSLFYWGARLSILWDKHVRRRLPRLMPPPGIVYRGD